MEKGHSEKSGLFLLLIMVKILCIIVEKTPRSE